MRSPGLHLIHGFNRDPGLFAGLSADLGAAGIDHNIIDYGLSLTLSTRNAVQAILMHCRDGDSIIAHSNGAVAAYQAAVEYNLRINTLIMIQPPLNRFAGVPLNIRNCACIWNTGDRLVSLASVFGGQYHGDMGRLGPPQGSHIESIQVSRQYGHSRIFTRPDWRSVIVTLAQQCAGQPVQQPQARQCNFCDTSAKSAFE